MEKEQVIVNKLAFQTLENIVLAAFDEVLYFEYIPKKQRWSLRLTSNECHVLKSTTTSKLLLAKHDSFVQISQSCIINIKYLQSIENMTLKCRLYPPFSNIELSMSQRYYANLRSVLDPL